MVDISLCDHVLRRGFEMRRLMAHKRIRSNDVRRTVFHSSGTYMTCGSHKLGKNVSFEDIRLISQMFVQMINYYVHGVYYLL